MYWSLAYLSIALPRHKALGIRGRLFLSIPEAENSLWIETKERTSSSWYHTILQPSLCSPSKHTCHFWPRFDFLLCRNILLILGADCFVSPYPRSSPLNPYAGENMILEAKESNPTLVFLLFTLSNKQSIFFSAEEKFIKAATSKLLQLAFSFQI